MKKLMTLTLSAILLSGTAMADAQTDAKTEETPTPAVVETVAEKAPVKMDKEAFKKITLIPEGIVTT